MTTKERKTKKQIEHCKVRSDLHDAAIRIDAILCYEQIDDPRIDWSLNFCEIERYLGKVERRLKTLGPKDDAPCLDCEGFKEYFKEYYEALLIRKRLESLKTIIEKFRLLRA